MERKIDVEKVSKGLECCRNRNTGCDNCPYRVLESASCIVQLLNESFSAVKQLSEQVEKLTDKHWSEYRQIAHYSDKTQKR